MAQDTIGNWLEKAKASETTAKGNSQIKVIRREQPLTRGNMIMEIAEKLRPLLLDLFKGARGKDGMLMQPAHIRGIALNMAQDFVKIHEEESKDSK